MYGRQYYDSIDHFILYNNLCDLIPDQAFCRLILRSLTAPVIYQGVCRPVDKGLSRSNPLSPLLGAIALLPLDQAMQELPVFYCRYMDDWVIIADSRWRLKRAIKKMHRVLAELGLALHPDKTFIGRVEKGLDFPGYRLYPEKLTLSSAAADRVREKLIRLYEQGADNNRIGCFLLRWCAAVRGGGELFACVVSTTVLTEIFGSMLLYGFFAV